MDIQAKTQDQDRMNSQSNLVMIQQNQTQDTQSSYKTSVSFGPSGLATHCVQFPVLLYPNLETSFLKTKTGPLDMELEMDGYG